MFGPRHRWPLRVPPRQYRPRPPTRRPLRAAQPAAQVPARRRPRPGWACGFPRWRPSVRGRARPGPTAPAAGRRGRAEGEGTPGRRESGGGWGSPGPIGRMEPAVACRVRSVLAEGRRLGRPHARPAVRRRRARGRLGRRARRRGSHRRVRARHRRDRCAGCRRGRLGGRRGESGGRGCRRRRGCGRRRLCGLGSIGVARQRASADGHEHENANDQAGAEEHAPRTHRPGCGPARRQRRGGVDGHRGSP